MATTFLSKSVGSINEKTFTTSFWVKKTTLGDEQHILGNFVDGNNRTHFFFRNEDTFQVFQNIGGTAHSCITNRKFRDTNAWYHIVVAIDTTQATASNRCRIYVNGVEETLDGPTYHNQNTNLSIRGTHYIGKYYGSNDHYFGGGLSHLHFIDGTNYDATAFGETDSTTGEWKIKTSPSVTYGTEGYFILKDGNSVTNQAGNSAGNFSVGGGTLTKTEDNPSNVFATFNALIPYNGTFSNGMTTYQAPSSNPVFGSLSTLGMSSGKFYAECKYSAGSNHYLILGIADNNFNPNASTPDDLGKTGTTKSIAYVVNTGAYRVNNNNTSWGSAGGDGDILQIAVDKDNNKVFFGVNGTWGASSNPATGSYGIDVSSVLTGDTWFFGVSNDTGASETVAQFNFGNGYFGTTAVSSAGTNASGNGIFEYDVPTGYTALSTKGLNL